MDSKPSAETLFSEDEELGEAPCSCDCCGAEVEDDAWECWWCGSELL